MTRNVEERVAQVVRCISAGGVALVPTDTVYGLAVSPLCPEAVARVYELKGRPRGLNLPVMIAAQADVFQLGVEINDSVEKLMRSRYVPGPLTLAMGFRSGRRPSWLEGRVEVAIRIPKNKRMRGILRQTGPLLVTSANRHGCETRESVSEILNQLVGTPDILIDDGALRTVPSTLVNCRVRPPTVEREGCVPAVEIESLLR